jgi:hypothetical protein
MLLITIVYSVKIVTSAECLRIVSRTYRLYDHFVISGNRIHISTRVSGVLLVPEGAPSVYTLDPGRTVKVVRVRDESSLVEIETEGHRLLFSKASLEQHGQMVSTA